MTYEKKIKNILRPFFLILSNPKKVFIRRRSFRGRLGLGPPMSTTSRRLGMVLEGGRGSGRHGGGRGGGFAHSGRRAGSCVQGGMRNGVTDTAGCGGCYTSESFCGRVVCSKGRYGRSDRPHIRHPLLEGRMTKSCRGSFCG